MSWYIARIVYMDVLLPEGNNPGSSSQLQNPAAFQEKTPVVLFWVSPNWISADVFLPKSLLNAKDLLRK